MDKRQLRWITAAAVAVLCLSVLPMLWIGQYLHPFADDYVFGAGVYRVWTESHSLTTCVGEAWRTAATMWRTWQGTYSACFLMALQPGVFGQYWLGPVLLLSSLAGSTYLLLYMLMRRVLRATRTEYLFVSTVFVLATVQFAWSYYDAFFWYNGAMYYTLFYSLSLLTASLLLGLHLTERRAWRYVAGVLSLLLVLVTAGGNFVSGLGMGALLSAVILVLRMERGRWPRFLVAVLLVYGAAFAVSVLAPGNSFRQVTVVSKPGVAAAFLIAVGKSLAFFSETTGVLQSLLLATAVPVVARVAVRSRYRFSHPWVFLLVTWAVYASFFFAHSYAMGTRGPDRVQNVYSYVRLWLILADVFYLSGALLRRASSGGPLSTAIMGLVGAVRWKYAGAFRLAPVFTVLLLVLSVTVKPTATNRTCSLLLKGTAQRYDREMKARERALTASVRPSLVLRPLTVRMPSDAFSDIAPYPGYWINQGMARYYGKERVTALPSALSEESPAALLARCKRDVGPGNLRYAAMR